MNSQKTHLAVISAAVFLFYADSFNNFFVWNDWTLIIENFLLKGWWNLPEIFASAFWKPLLGEPPQIYRPLVLVSFMADLAYWGLNPWGFHLVNLLLHVLNSALGYLLFRLYVPSTTALMGSVLFASHPIHTGAVTYISGRAELLMTFFLLSGILSFLQSEKYPSRLLYLLSLLLFFLALLTKETAVVFPLLLVVADWTVSPASWHNRISGRLARYLGPAAVIALYFVLRAAFVGGATSGYVPSLSNSLLQFLVAIKSISLYLGLLFLPWNLHFLHRIEPPLAPLSLQLWLSLLLLTGAGWGLQYALRSGSQTVVFSLLWLLVYLFPLAYLSGFSQSFIESWYYSPSLGFFLLVGLGLSRLQFWSVSRIYLWLTLLIAVVLGGLTVNRNRDWKNDLQIALHVSTAAPDDAVAMRLLGHAYFRRGRTQEAEKAFQTAISLSPGDPRAHESLGRLYSFMGRDKEARASYQRMLELAPRDAYSHWRQGRFYLERRNFAEAEKYFAEAARLFPYSSELRNDLAQVYYRQGKLDAARVELEAALRISPYSSTLQENLKRALKGRQPS